MRITVLGGGSWGTALGHLLAGKGDDVTLLVRDQALAEAISQTRQNPRYLPGIPLCPSLTATTDTEAALVGIDILVLATPCQFMREALLRTSPYIKPGTIAVCASKGIEVGSLKRMSEVVADAAPALLPRYAMLSGPSFAKEVIEGKPTAVVLACADAQLGERLRAAFSTQTFRVYSSTDLVGVELGGAVKNVMAIAAGLCDGLGLGHNARAALITRGLAEMGRLGKALGARGSTFMGLSGMGDLVLTCTGDLSRNRQVGMQLAAGKSMAAITAATNTVAEGIKTTEAVRVLGESHGVDMPLADAVGRILSEEVSPAQMVDNLMARALREE